LQLWQLLAVTLMGEREGVVEGLTEMRRGIADARNFTINHGRKNITRKIKGEVLAHYSLSG
jgi:hypothetical protein